MVSYTFFLFCSRLLGLLLMPLLIGILLMYEGILLCPPLEGCWLSADDMELKLITFIEDPGGVTF
jgi:hypothetical protein